MKFLIIIIINNIVISRLEEDLNFRKLYICIVNKKVNKKRLMH